MNKQHNLKCIRCDKEINILECENQGCKFNGYNSPLFNAVWCQAEGQYGSTVIDRCTTAEPIYFFVICDECAKETLLKEKYAIESMSEKFDI